MGLAGSLFKTQKKMLKKNAECSANDGRKSELKIKLSGETTDHSAGTKEFFIFVWRCAVSDLIEF